MRKSVSLVAVAAAIAIAAVPVGGNNVLYTIVDLGTLVNCCGNGIESSALGINNAGAVAGFTETTLGNEDLVSPFIYQNGEMALISTSFGWATGINDEGQVTGFVQFPSRPSSDAFLYQNGALTDLATLPGHGYVGLPYSIGRAINQAGTIVGESKSQAMIYKTA
jgi:probable HAF family extracellular repeat protein